MLSSLKIENVAVIEKAEILFIGEAPGEKEDLSGTPFVGRAGQLLDKFLFAVDIPRESIYIANILKCRPPKNRDPKPDEEDACMDYLREQVRLIKPKMIVCLGRISAQRLIDPNYRITKEHGQWVCSNGVWMTAIYHPSALLRDPSKRPETFEDLLCIRDKIQECIKNRDKILKEYAKFREKNFCLAEQDVNRFLEGING